MKLRDVVSREQLKWSDIGFGPVEGRWPAVSMARGTSAWSQLQKIDIEKGEVVLGVCVGDSAPPGLRGRITGFYLPDHFTAPLRNLVKPSYFLEILEEYGSDRWPDSVACRAAYRFIEPPLVGDQVGVPRLITWTRGRYLAELPKVAPELYDKLANLEIEPLELFRSPDYDRLAAQPRAATYRQAGRTPSVPKDLQRVLHEKVKRIFGSADQSGKIYEYQQPERRVTISETALFLIVLETWEAQGGRCAYCSIPMETGGLAQVTVDRIDNTNREYGRHNIHLTCWECNRGKGDATHDEMLEIYEKRRNAWEKDRQNDKQGVAPE